MFNNNVHPNIYYNGKLITIQMKNLSRFWSCIQILDENDILKFVITTNI